MALYCSIGGPDAVLDDATLHNALTQVLESLGARKRVLTVPPDFTRFYSKAGFLTMVAHEHYGDAMVDVLPALGTHFPMTPEQLDRMFPGLPHDLIRDHDWRNDVLTIGEVPSEYVREVTDGIWDRPWPAQLNRLVWEGEHDLILSIGQVVPHEVIGMANYNKNLFVGTGGATGINESHFIGAAYGMERMMGRADTPLRRILNRAEELYCQDLPVLYVQTVVGPDETGTNVVRGMFVGDDPECFERAAELALHANFTLLDEPLDRVVVYLDPEEFHSTWLGNKAIYRTRMAMADEGHLTVLGPEVATFGEDPEIDRLIRKYGYRSSPEVMQMVDDNEDLQANLSAAAHLIHGSPEGRFKVTWCPGQLSEQDVRNVGYDWADPSKQLQRYHPDRMKEGWNTMPDGERVYYIHNPALGLWSWKERFA